MTKYRMLSINEVCSGLFSSLGAIIGRNPKPFIILPVITAIILALGPLNLNYINDIEYLYTLTNGEAWREHDLVKEYFPQDTAERFTPSRLLDPGRFARLIVQRKDGESILNSETWGELGELDEVIRSISVDYNGVSMNYSELCCSWNGACYSNEHLGLGTIMDRIENKTLRLSYPVMFNPVTHDTYPMNLFFSGFSLNGTTITAIKFISLDYFARTNTPENDARGRKWEEAVVKRLGDLKSEWRHIDVAYTTYSSLGNELERNTFSVFPFLVVSISCTFAFVMSTSWTGDWVTSKPLVSALGIFSAFLGTIAGTGLLCGCGVPFIAINAAIPFVALGVGVDDTFVMLSAWWRTSRKESVEKRMSKSYSEAAVSVTVTTLTDVLSFYVGILSPTPSVQIFCIYAGTCVLFIYIFHITFFGGIIALSGQFEEENRHSLFIWTKVAPKKEIGNGERTPKPDPGNDVESENAVMAFFRDSYFPFLNKKITKVAILVVYVVYLALSAWGITQMKEGLKLSNLATSDSHIVSYYDLFDEHFREYPYRSQIVITTPLDYSKKETQQLVTNYLRNVTKLKSMTPDYMENWLTDFLRFVNNYNDFYDLNITTEQNFIDTLREFYIKDSSPLSEDIKFNENFTKIIATRYIVQHFQSPDAKAEKTLLIAWRDLSQTVREKMEATVFHPFDMLLDVSVVLQKMTLTLVSIAAGIVMVVAIIFIPNLTSVLLVFLSITSVEVGVLGFMVFWNINLDIISVITLIMCIGFSVDFPAHVSYAYISSGGDTAEERVKRTVHSLGLPILQGAISTIIALSGLFMVSSYIYSVFFKVVTLVMIFSVFIALFVLPVVLLLIKPNPKQKCLGKEKQYPVNE